MSTILLVDLSLSRPILEGLSNKEFGHGLPEPPREFHLDARRPRRSRAFDHALDDLDARAVRESPLQEHSHAWRIERQVQDASDTIGKRTLMPLWSKSVALERGDVLEDVGPADAVLRGDDEADACDRFL